jgi:aspartate-semialdehyde dehydrogenase
LEEVQAKMEVGLLGATGPVAQQFIALLQNHPWFKLTWLAASEPLKGRRYGNVPWLLTGRTPEGICDQKIEALRPGVGPTLVFSALSVVEAGQVERAFAEAGHFVIGNAESLRTDPLIPVLIPEVNAEHLDLVAVQQDKRWTGAIVSNPNGAAMFLAIALAALRDFRVRRVVVTTLEAFSGRGAGYPGVSALDAAANLLPWIDGEEQRIETETRKILGRLRDDSVEECPVEISAQAALVPVAHGHTEVVSVDLEECVTNESIIRAFREFSGVPQAWRLPSAPPKPIVYHDARDRPQPRLDAETAGGMVLHVGRLRTCPVLSHTFILLGHNTIRGAAGLAILSAELAVARALFRPSDIA